LSERAEKLKDDINDIINTNKNAQNTLFEY